MKTITFIRHAKSDHSFTLTDQKRPLNERGRREAKMMGLFLQNKLPKPDVMLCSIAVRARETFEIMRNSGLFPNTPFYIETDLYTFEGDEVLQFLRRQDDTWSHVIIFGHNPAFSEASGHLLGDHSIQLKTSAVQSIQLDIEHWDQIGQKKGVSLLKAHPSK